jgi:RND family efflux transporter MFP subunit
MEMMCVKRLWFACLASVCLMWVGPVHAEGTPAITRPNKDVTLRFTRPGRIASLLVKEGDDVKGGQLLAQQDDAAERVQLAQLKAQAEDNVRIRAGEAQLEQKKVELGKLEEAYGKKAVSKWDVDRARLDVAIAGLSLELAKFQHDQDRLKYEEARIQVERMRLESPVAGKVEKTFLKTGESVDERADVVRVVQIDPLWIDVPVLLAEARTLKLSQTAHVAFPDGAGRPATGKIIHVASVADAASDTLTVRVELPNPAGRPAGEHVTVTFPTAR